MPNIRCLPFSAQCVAFPLLCMAAFSSLSATAQQSVSGSAAGDAPATLDAVSVTGTRGRPRTVVESPSPIDVIPASELQRTGKTGLLSALNDLVPSFNMPAKSGNGTSYAVATGGLRGLNPDQTLYLVNGKRRHRTANINVAGQVGRGSVPVDINLIPVSMVARVEILRDGAAAQYGSDAIAGVVNIILKSNDSGGQLDTSWGQNIDRSDGNLGKFDLEHGFKLGDNGFLTLSMDAMNQKASNRAEPIAGSIRLYPLLDGQADPREATANRLVTTNFGAAPQKGFNLGYNMEVGVGQGYTRFYSFGTLGRRQSDVIGIFRYPNSDNNIIEVYPDGYTPIVRIKEKDFDLTAGLKGVVGEWNWDLSSSFGRNTSDRYGEDTLNVSLGPDSPTHFYEGAVISTDWSTTFDMTRAYDWGGKPLQVSWGLEHRYEKYALKAGGEASYEAGDYVPDSGSLPAIGAQFGVTFQPSDAGQLNRNSFAGYVDAGYNVTKRWFVDLAGRYEHFDDASGSTAVGKFSTRFEITPTLAIRGTVSTGFRAPSLAQELYAATTSSWRYVDGDRELYQSRIVAVESPVAVALGAEPLKPEESTSFSVGLAWHPAQSLVVTLDAYQIDVNHRIVLTGALTGTAVAELLNQAGISDVSSVQYFTNAIDTRTRGVDLVGTWQQDAGDWGNITWSMGFNYNKTDITHIVDTPETLTSLGQDYVLFDRSSQGTLLRTPKTKLLLGANWRFGAWSIAPKLSRYGSMDAWDNDPVNDLHTGAKWMTDLEVGYRVSDRISVAIGASNLFNVYPDKGIYSAAYGSGQYLTNTPYGFTGGFYYARISVVL